MSILTGTGNGARVGNAIVDVSGGLLGDASVRIKNIQEALKMMYDEREALASRIRDHEHAERLLTNMIEQHVSMTSEVAEEKSAHDNLSASRTVRSL